MLDMKFVRENPDAIDKAMADRQSSWDREKFFELDDERRSVIGEVEELQATRNAELSQRGLRPGAPQGRCRQQRQRHAIHPESRRGSREDRRHAARVRTGHGNALLGRGLHAAGLHR